MDPDESQDVDLQETDLLSQYRRALDLLCGLHPGMTIDGPPEVVAQRIFDQVSADRRATIDQIDSLQKSLDYFRLKR